MVLIITEQFDPVTDRLILWLLSNGIPFIRINEDTPVELKRIDIEEKHVFLLFMINNIELTLNDIKYVIYRKGDIKWLVRNTDISKVLGEGVLNYYNEELTSITKFVMKCLFEQAPHFGEYKGRSVNKLECVLFAANCGFSIPKTFIRTEKRGVQTLGNKFVTKPISNVFSTLYDNRYDFRTLTSIIDTDNKTNPLPGHFFPSLIQEKIDKKFEIRVFFLNDNIFSIAILSSKLDIRSYEANNKFLILNLPLSIKQKIINFKNLLNLSTGSIDLIYSNDNKYFFLEVNPLGQFDYFYTYCNIDIESFIVNEIKIHYGLDRVN